MGSFIRSSVYQGYRTVEVQSVSDDRLDFSNLLQKNSPGKKVLVKKKFKNLTKNAHFDRAHSSHFTNNFKYKNNLKPFYNLERGLTKMLSYCVDKLKKELFNWTIKSSIVPKTIGIGPNL
ncbi:hypothetical protein BpHYR1_053466 [Brachionus plicatilis]|uniref:Uncharacterized protein n=1 Tax=Brachionus plicatilis TaxID=10195 RepID=A0A3M7QRC0_BRAPC|nr:hypothetical protein BpHYR1_053466 [Brachionus plicatilis]